VKIAYKTVESNPSGLCHQGYAIRSAQSRGLSVESVEEQSPPVLQIHIRQLPPS